MVKNKRVTKKESSQARTFACKVFEHLHHGMSPRYKFNVRLVGSARTNTILRTDDGFWDIDYQILLSNNSKQYKENKFSNPTTIKNDFFNFFNEAFGGHEQFKVENSTTSITLIDYKNKYSFDFVIIRDGGLIIRRNNNKESSVNRYTWNQLPKFNNAYLKFKKMNPVERVNLIEERILPRKAFEKKKNINDPTRKSSYEIFVEEVINY